MRSVRVCFECCTPISGCMGCVVAGDFVRAIQRVLLSEDIPLRFRIRERCGRCVERILLSSGWGIVA